MNTVPRNDSWVVVLYLLLTVAALWWALAGVDFSLERTIARGPQMGRIFTLMFGPEAWNRPPQQLAEFLAKIAVGLRESLQIALLGTALAAVLALPFGALAARNLSPIPATSYAGKVLLNLIRAFPELMLAVAFVRAVGLGPFAGVLAVAIHSIGMMGKLYAERIETVDKGAIEALTATGASPLETFRHAILPEVLPDFLSFALYRFDLNMRSASVLGLVGAGGIGSLLQLQRLGNNWRNIGLILISIVVSVILVELLSTRLRAKFGVGLLSLRDSLETSSVVAVHCYLQEA